MAVLNCVNQIQQRLTFCFHINLDFLVSDNWQFGNILDEVEEKVIRVWGSPIHLRAQVEEQVVFRRLHMVIYTHLEMKSPMILHIIS